MQTIQVPIAGSDRPTTVDLCDYEAVSMIRWHADRDGYPNGRVGGRKQLLHRFILKAPREFCVDHIDRDRLNNTRSNLRFVTVAENALNKSPRAGSSKFRGVCWVAKWHKWQVYLNRRYVGGFSDELDAAAAWLEAAEPVYGALNILSDRRRLIDAIEARKGIPPIPQGEGA